MQPIYTALVLLCSWAVAIEPRRQTAGSGGGAQLAITQKFLDFAGDTIKTVALDVLKNLPYPSDVHGDQDDFTFDFTQLKTATADGDIAVKLSPDSSIHASVTNINVDITGHLHAKENIWPHYPTGDCSMTASGTGSADVTFTVTESAGIPSVTLNSCNADITASTDFHDCTSIGLDVLLDLFNGLIDDGLTKALKAGVCKGAQGLANTLNSVLRSFSYHLNVPFPAPFNQAVLDFHLATSPAATAAADDKDYYYIGNDFTAEVTSKQAPSAHFPSPPPPAPKLYSSDLSYKMATAVLTPYPFDSLLWTFYNQRVLQHLVQRGDIAGTESYFNTNHYKVYLPALSAKYPNQTMTVLFNVTSQPKLTMAPSGVSLSNNLTLLFYVGQPSQGGVLAFTLWSLFNDTVAVTSNGTSIFASLSKASIALRPGVSRFGSIGLGLIADVSAPIGTILNLLIIPVLNKVLQKGVKLPAFSRAINRYGIGTVTAELVDAKIQQKAGYVTIGSDASITVTPQYLDPTYFLQLLRDILS